jgi:hypothetical protein
VTGLGLFPVAKLVDNNNIRPLVLDSLNLNKNKFQSCKENENNVVSDAAFPRSVHDCLLAMLDRTKNNRITMKARFEDHPKNECGYLMKCAV